MKTMVLILGITGILSGIILFPIKANAQCGSCVETDCVGSESASTACRSVTTQSRGIVTKWPYIVWVNTTVCEAYSTAGCPVYGDDGGWGGLGPLDDYCPAPLLSCYGDSY